MQIVKKSQALKGEGMILRLIISVKQGISLEIVYCTYFDKEYERI